MQLSNSATTSDPSLAALLLPATGVVASATPDATNVPAPFADLLGAVANLPSVVANLPGVAANFPGAVALDASAEAASSTTTPTPVAWPFRALRRVTAEMFGADATPKSKPTSGEKNKTASDELTPAATDAPIVPLPEIASVVDSPVPDCEVTVEDGEVSQQETQRPVMASFASIAATTPEIPLGAGNVAKPDPKREPQSREAVAAASPFASEETFSADVESTTSVAEEPDATPRPEIPFSRAAERASATRTSAEVRPVLPASPAPLPAAATTADTVLRVRPLTADVVPSAGSTVTEAIVAEPTLPAEAILWTPSLNPLATLRPKSAAIASTLAMDATSATTSDDHAVEAGSNLSPIPVALPTDPRVSVEAPSRQIETGFSSSDDAANIAVGNAFAAPEISRRENVAPRNFVTTTEKQLTALRADLGTGVAKSVDAMPAASTLPRSTHAAFEPASLLVGRVDSFSDSMSSHVPAQPEAVNTAQRAVEAVLNAAHRFSSGDRHAVNLQFSVAGADLNVRVELRADQVRATFQTDSASLRAALSQEWQSSAAASGDRTLKFVAPVFTGNDSNGFSSFSGDHASQQQRQSLPQQNENAFAFTASRDRALRSSSSEAAAVSTPVARVAPSTALHLHTLA